jgi:hypothetical protein
MLGIAVALQIPSKTHVEIYLTLGQFSEVGPLSGDWNLRYPKDYHCE